VDNKADEYKDSDDKDTESDGCRIDGEVHGVIISLNYIR
jgi:hypothetical protein